MRSSGAYCCSNQNSHVCKRVSSAAGYGGLEAHASTGCAGRSRVTPCRQDVTAAPHSAHAPLRRRPVPYRQERLLALSGRALVVRVGRAFEQGLVQVPLGQQCRHEVLAKARFLVVLVRVVVVVIFTRGAVVGMPALLVIGVDAGGGARDDTPVRFSAPQHRRRGGVTAGGTLAMVSGRSGRGTVRAHTRAAPVVQEVGGGELAASRGRTLLGGLTALFLAQRDDALAVTANGALPPLVTLKPAGWLVMAGGMMTESAAAALVAVPTELLTVTE